MPLQNIDKTTRNRNKRNLSKLVMFPTLVFGEVDDCRIAQQQEGVDSISMVFAGGCTCSAFGHMAPSLPPPNHVGTNP